MQKMCGFGCMNIEKGFSNLLQTVEGFAHASLFKGDLRD